MHHFSRALLLSGRWCQMCFCQAKAHPAAFQEDPEVLQAKRGVVVLNLSCSLHPVGAAQREAARGYRHHVSRTTLTATCQCKGRATECWALPTSGLSAVCEWWRQSACRENNKYTICHVVALQSYLPSYFFFSSWNLFFFRCTWGVWSYSQLQTRWSWTGRWLASPSDTAGLCSQTTAGCWRRTADWNWSTRRYLESKGD